MPRTETVLCYTEIIREISDDGRVLSTRLGRSWQSLTGATKKKPAKKSPQEFEVEEGEQVEL